MSKSIVKMDELKQIVAYALKGNSVSESRALVAEDAEFSKPAGVTVVDEFDNPIAWRDVDAELRSLITRTRQREVEQREAGVHRVGNARCAFSDGTNFKPNN